MPKPEKPSRSARGLTRLFAIAGAALVVVAVAGCDTKNAPGPVPGTTAPRQVTVVGDGKVDGTPTR